MKLEYIYAINLAITSMAFGVWKESFAAGVFMGASIFGISIFILSIIGGVWGGG